MPRVLVVGYNAWDVIVSVGGALPRDGKLDVPSIVFSGGGPAATAAFALARLGADVRLVTPLADDLPGELQRRELLAAGVDLGLSPRRAGHASPRAVILVDRASGERTILASRGDLPPLAPHEVNPKWLADAELLYCDGHEIAASLTLAVEARRRGLPVVFDAGSVRPDAEKLVALCTDVVSSTLFAPALTGESEPHRALRALSARGPSRVAMTFGVAGSLTLVSGELHHVPAFSVPVQDTTGAGDAFHAGYAFARLRGEPLLACLEFASAVAALKCRQFGGRSGLPRREEVEALLRDGRRRRERPQVAGSAAQGHSIAVPGVDTGE